MTLNTLSPPAPALVDSAPPTHLPELQLNKILAVDDTPLNIRLLELMFKDSEYELLTAVDGEEGLAMLQAEWPFLIISDIQMPRLDGYEFCAAIKNDPQMQRAAVILVTAHDQSVESVSRGLGLGADEFIFRPFKKEELLARVEAVARMKRAELAAQQQTRMVAQHNAHLTLLNELALATTSSLDLNAILDEARRQLAELLQAEASVIVLCHPETDQLAVHLTIAGGKTLSLAHPYIFERPLEAVEIQLLVPDVIEQLLNTQASAGQLSMPPSTICVPMINQKLVIGAVGVVNSPQSETLNSDWSLLNSAGSIITIAVENARLFAQVQDFNRELEDMVAQRTHELAREKRKLEAILTSMGDAVLVLDADQRLLTLNTCAQYMFNLSAEAALGLRLDDASLNGPIWTGVRNLLQQPDEHPSLSFNVSDESQSDGVLSLQANAATVELQSGEVIGTVVVLGDVTEITAVERMKARFMAGVTHELKTPLAVIGLHTKNLATYHDRLPKPKRAQLLTAVQDQVKLLEQLIGDILDLSRLDSGLINMKKQPTDLTKLMDRVVQDLQQLADSKKQRLHWRPGPGLTLNIDPDQMNRVCTNLVSNAIKYTPDGGQIWVTVAPVVQESRQVAQIQVRDTGIGIPPDEQKRIFDRFYRVDTSHTIPGTGLGLAIVKEIVAAHQGTIDVESQPEQGSTFTVQLELN